VVEYPIYDRLVDVPDETWADPDMVVERFLPERDELGYHIRTWVFFGDREISRCLRGDDPWVKALNSADIPALDIPDFIRAERARLGLDYGKFDFVIHNGDPVLFDANKTPGAPPPSPTKAANFAHLAGGIEALLATAPVTA
jgi:hypothetical protein